MHERGVVEWDDRERDECADDVWRQYLAERRGGLYRERGFDGLGEGAAERGFFVVGDQGGGD